MEHADELEGLLWDAIHTAYSTVWLPDASILGISSPWPVGAFVLRCAERDRVISDDEATFLYNRYWWPTLLKIQTNIDNRRRSLYATAWPPWFHVTAVTITNAHALYVDDTYEPIQIMLDGLRQRDVQ